MFLLGIDWQCCCRTNHSLSLGDSFGEAIGSSANPHTEGSADPAWVPVSAAAGLRIGRSPHPLGRWRTLASERCPRESE